MSTTTHTPGPWRAVGGGFIQAERRHAVNAATRQNDVDICRWFSDCTFAGQAEANAALIAAAPDLLAALRFLRGWLANDEETLEHLHDQVVSSEASGSIHDNAVRILIETAERAIAKAEGRS